MTTSQKIRMLRCAASFITAAYDQVRLAPHDLRALPAELFAKPPYFVSLIPSARGGERMCIIFTFGV
jgi:hypothetical protein